MSRLALELNDTGFLVLPEEGEGPAPSPGVALVEGGQIVVGQPALARSRHHPRLVHNRFWDRLDTTPLRRPFPGHLRRADLAHAHLQALWQDCGPGIDQVLLVIPGVFSKARLELVLGIARTCGMPVCGLVDAAVAAGASLSNAHSRLAPRMLHLDLTLHRAVLSELVHDGATLERTRVETSDQVGQAMLEERWAGMIAERFIHQTRFDPLHAAATEQALYDRLPGYLDELRRRRQVAIPIEASGREHRIELSRQELVSATASLYQRLADLAGNAGFGPGVPLLVSARLAALPDLVPQLQGGGGEVHALPILAAPAGALAHAGQITCNQEALPFVARLAVESDTPVASPAADRARPAGSDRPTHVLLDGHAYPIGTGSLGLGSGPDNGAGQQLVVGGLSLGVSRRHCTIHAGDQVLVTDHSRLGTSVNGEPITGRAVVLAGDRLRLGEPGIEVDLIRVEDGDGDGPA
jgi:hypothetical protein